MAFVAPKRPYSCPHCKETFTKWGLCQTHLRQNAECRESMGDATVDELQELCRTAPLAGATGAADSGTVQAENSELPTHPVGTTIETHVASNHASESAKAAPFLVPEAVLDAMCAEAVNSVKADVPFHDPGFLGPSPANRIVSSVNKRLARAVQAGYLTEPESNELEDKFDDLAACPEAVQEQVMDKFFSLGIGDVRWVVNKGDWLLRCIQFCSQLSPPNPRNSRTQTHLLVEALAAHALRREALSAECWDHFATMTPEVKVNVCEAVRNGILVNVMGSLSDHFLNVCCNERIIVDLETGPKPRLNPQPEALEWDALDESLYKNVVQQIIYEKRNSEERLLRDAAQVDLVPTPGTPGSLLATHTATSAARQQCSAEVMSALHAAAAGGLTRICARLIAEGLDIDERAGCQQTTALHLAASHGEVEVLRLLVRKRADVNVHDGEDHTPLYRAVQTAAQLNKHGQGSSAASVTHLSLQQTACQLLLSAGAESTPEGNFGENGGSLSPEHLAEKFGLINLRNVIRLYKRLHGVKSKLELDELTIDSFMRLQYETAMFTIGVFEKHVVVSRDAGWMEFHALVESFFICDRDKLQRIGNRLHKKVPAWTKKCSDALVELPLEAGELAINTLSFEEVSPHVFSLDLPRPRPPPPPPLPPPTPGDNLPGGGDGDSKARGNNDDTGADGASKVETARAGIPAQEVSALNDSSPDRRYDEHVNESAGEAGPPLSNQVCAPGFGEPTDQEPQLTQKYLAHLRGPKVQELARERRQDNEAFFRILGIRARGGRREDASWKKEIERRIDLLLMRDTTPLVKRDFDFRVRRFLLEFSVHSTIARVSEALVHMETATTGKGRDEVRSWPAYLATLLRRFDPKLYESLVERDRRSRTEPRRGAEGGPGEQTGPEESPLQPSPEAEAEGVEVLGEGESLHSSDDEEDTEGNTAQDQQPSSGGAVEPQVQAVRPYHAFQ